MIRVKGEGNKEWERDRYEGNTNMQMGQNVYSWRRQVKTIQKLILVLFKLFCRFGHFRIKIQCFPVSSELFYCTPANPYGGSFTHSQRTHTDTHRQVPPACTHADTHRYTQTLTHRHRHRYKWRDTQKHPPHRHIQIQKHTGTLMQMHTNTHSDRHADVHRDTHFQTQIHTDIGTHTCMAKD